MLNTFFQNLGTIGTFLGGVAAILAIIGGPKLLSIFRREVIKVNTACMNRLIKQGLEHEASKWNPSDYYTLDIEFQSGHRLHVPMFPGRSMIVQENVEMCVNDHSEEFTELGLRCTGIGNIDKHRHATNIEVIHVERGTVTCLETGNIYRAGDIWTIEPGEWHSATFQHCYCRVIHKPCLPTAADSPMDLKAIPT